MMSSLRLILPLLAACLISGCVHGESWHGDFAHIKTSVRFVSATGVPLKGETVAIIETGFLETVLDSRRTDADGWIALDGDFCLPVRVAVDGGYAAIRAGEVRDLYVVRVSPDRQPTVKRLWGELRADADALKRSTRYRRCDF
jgi:hypothetical protein